MWKVPLPLNPVNQLKLVTDIQVGQEVIGLKDKANLIEAELVTLLG